MATRFTVATLRKWILNAEKAQDRPHLPAVFRRRRADYPVHLIAFGILSERSAFRRAGYGRSADPTRWETHRLMASESWPYRPPQWIVFPDRAGKTGRDNGTGFHGHRPAG